MGEILWQIGMPTFVGCIIYFIMRKKPEHKARAWWVIFPVVYSISGICLGLDDGTFCLRSLLGFLLWKAAEEDQCTHEVADARSFEVLLVCFGTWSLISPLSRILGLCLLFLPQFLVSIMSEKKGVGGADIKFSGALGFLLGPIPGALGLSLGLLLFLFVYGRKKGKNASGQPLIPMISLGMAVASYFVF